MALSISGGNGSVTSQASTQTPQNSVAPANNAAPGGRVQAGTATSLLTSESGNNGIALTNHALPTVTVNGTSTGTVQAPQAEPGRHHKVNDVLLGVVIILAVIAAVLFVSITRSAKNTTNY